MKKKKKKKLRIIRPGLNVGFYMRRIELKCDV